MPRGLQQALHFYEHRHRTRVYPFVLSEVQGHEVADEDEVEELREGAAPLGLHLDHSGHRLADELRDEAEAALHLRVLEVAAKADDRRHLARHVAVLTEPADLVVAPLGLRGEEGRRLGVLVHLGLPPAGGDRADPGRPQHERDRATRAAARSRARLHRPRRARRGGGGAGRALRLSR